MEENELYGYEREEDISYGADDSPYEEWLQETKESDGD